MKGLDNATIKLMASDVNDFIKEGGHGQLAVIATSGVALTLQALISAKKADELPYMVTSKVRSLLRELDNATRLNTNKRTITAWVAFLINHNGVPIGSRRSMPSGYYLITSDEERNNAIAPLTAQALEELKRAEKLRSIDLHT